MKKFLLFMVLIVLGVAVPFMLALLRDTPPASTLGLPWDIEVDAQGSRVFGVRPGQSTLAEVSAAFGPDYDLAIIVSANETGTVEAYYSQLALGFVSAKVILTVDVPSALIADIKARTPKAAYMESGKSIKLSIASTDRERLMQFPVKALAVIPTVNLDEATLIQRFGPVGERLPVSDKRVHLLYPARGLDIVVDQDGKELLQYVAPRDFALLRNPLLAETAAGGK